MTNNPTTHTIETQKKEGEPKPYHITVEDLMNLEFGEQTPETEPELQTRMKESAAHDKCKFLLQHNFAIPTEWYSTEQGISVSKQYLACIHTLYTLASRARFMKEVQYDVSNSNLNEESLQIVLNWLNTWLDERIETKYPFREAVKVGDVSTNLEGYARSKGTVLNTDGKVNEIEMEEIMEIFKDRFKN